LVRSYPGYPPLGAIAFLLRINAPEVIILDFRLIDSAVEIACEIHRLAPGVQIISFMPECDSSSILKALHAGAREVLSIPLDRTQLESAIVRAREQIDRQPMLHPPAGDLYCFLPVKGGVGATTIAVNTALSLARQERVKPLLMDFDLNSGLVRFHLKLHGEFCTEDAVERANQLNGRAWEDVINKWEDVINKVDSLDVIHTGELNPDRRLAHTQIRNLTDMAVRIYSHVMMDFSPHLESYAQSAMPNATRIFLISTPELHSLHLAREKLKFLKKAGMGERISLVLNRATGTPRLSSSDIRKLLHIPIAAEIPNDYAGTQRALQKGCGVKPGTNLGKSFQEFARSLCGRAKVSPARRPLFNLPFLQFADGG
jgi:pilus assembly protein CpaE